MPSCSLAGPPLDPRGTPAGPSRMTSSARAPSSVTAPPPGIRDTTSGLCRPPNSPPAWWSRDGRCWLAGGSLDRPVAFQPIGPPIETGGVCGAGASREPPLYSLPDLLPRGLEKKPTQPTRSPVPIRPGPDGGKAPLGLVAISPTIDLARLTGIAFAGATANLTTAHRTQYDWVDATVSAPASSTPFCFPAGRS